MSEATTEDTQQEAQTQAPTTGDATGTNGGEQQAQPVQGADKTYTQADIDRIIGERIAKERSKQEAAVKKAQEESERKAAEAQGQYEKLYKETLDKLAATEAKTKALELATMQRDAAAKAGLPVAFADRLRGETPEDLEADAKALLASLPKPTAPNLNNEAGGGGKPAGGQVSEAERQNLASVLGVNPKYLNI